MDFFDLLKKRRACHHFLPGKEIPEEDIVKMIEYTSLTPSGYNAQPWEFVVIRSKAHLQKLSEVAFDQPHIQDASAAIVVLADTEIGRNVEEILKDWVELGYCSPEEVPAYRNSIAKNRSPEQKEKMALRNAMLACMTLIFAAENMGYASCPIMGFSPHKLEALLQIPPDRKIALLIALGTENPGKELPRLPRKLTSRLIHWNFFGNSKSA